MDTTQVIVTSVGLALILFTAKFFFSPSKVTAMSIAEVNGIQQQHILVKGGYSPSSVRVKAGKPVRLIFDRHETSSCSAELVIPELGIRRDLPPHKETIIDVTTMKVGTYEFACGMNMLRGTIIAE